ncbi:MAG: DUF3313 domain-containing protein [Brevundimonas sp.]
MRRTLSLILAAGALSACQTAPVQNAGFLSSYDGLETRGDTLRASIRERRDDALAQQVERVFIEPTALVDGAAPGISEQDVALVLGEVDRQVCFELSERFTVVPNAQPDAARVRAAVTRITPTNAAGSGVSAAASWFIPGPIGVRVPGSTGGLAAEAELLDVEGRQVAALAWARNATAVGTDDPSLSRVGDALQFVEPFGDQVGDTFAPADREVRPIAEPDPCARFGSRSQVGGFIAGAVTGLYVPQADGVRARPAETTPEPSEDR